MEEDESIGILGASSLVGDSLLNLLSRSRVKVIAFSRGEPNRSSEFIEWRKMDSGTISNPGEKISKWIFVAPIWVLPDYFEFLQSSGVKRIVVLSSTSRFTKLDSLDIGEQALAGKLVDSETRLKTWAETQRISWVILQPTMIYGHGKDKNITEIMRFILRWGFFPVIGKANGLRQPVHVEDVARACQSVFDSLSIWNQAYVLSGAETITYKAMVERIFVALEKQPRFIRIPRWSFRVALLGLNLMPRYRNWSIAMADRMENDMTFNYSEAQNAFKFSPRAFTLSENDLPRI